MKRSLKAVLVLACVAMSIMSSAAEEAPRGIAINIDLAHATALAAAANASRLKLVPGDLSQLSADTRLVVLEAAGPDLSGEDLNKLGAWVQQGGALLLSLSRSTGSMAFQLSFLSPTTAWHTESHAAARGSSYGTATAAEGDGEFFPRGILPGLTVPFHYEIRPWHAVERGEGRYERFARKIPFINLSQQSGDTFWTRPLLNRDWKIRLRGDDARQTPLLLTGLYGAGRVAVFASSAQDIDSSPGAAALWNPTLEWLAQSRSAHPSPAVKPASEVALDKAARTLTVTLDNPTDAPLPLQVVMRLLTWEQALVGDVLKEIQVPPHGTASAVLALPAPGPTQLQALDFCDAYDVRLGVLSSDGAALLNETHLAADLRPDVRLDVSTDDTRTFTYPFDAPGYDGQAVSFPFRMGLPTMVYAYPPGNKVNVAVKISNGIKNIAPLAQVSDETNPNSYVAALTDGAANGNLGYGAEGFVADSAWRGTAGRENVLSFTFPAACKIAGVTLNGSPDDLRKLASGNPAAVIVELDGHEVARAENLKERFLAEHGLVRLNFPLATGKVLRLKVSNKTVPFLYEVGIEGSTSDLPPPARSVLSVKLRNALTGEVLPVASQEMTVAPGTVQNLQYPVDLPPNSGKVDFYRLETTFAGQTSGAPFLEIQPKHPLKSADIVRPHDASGLNFSVANGFRTTFDLDTGAHDSGGGGGRPSADTLIWAYEHNMKQLGAGARTEIGRLYSSEGNTVYTTTPWRSFSNGVPFYEVATPIYIEKMKKGSAWTTSNTAMLNHGDRWDSGPAVDTLNGWQDYIGFDDYLRSKGQPGLKGKTRKEVSDEIHSQHESSWQQWNLERYLASIQTLHDSFAKEGKDVIIQGQGMPFVPPGYDKPPLSDMIRGLSQDSTWEMNDESVPYTTGFQLGVKAYDPGWKFSTQFVWGFESGVLDDPMWHIAVGTTEPARRNLYDKAFRGSITADGVYQSMHTYGYNMNAGTAYTMSANDFQEAWRTQERNSLLTPDGPIGAGLIVGVERYKDPAHALFSGGGMGDDWDHNPARQLVISFANVVRRLQNVGVPLPFAANVGALAKWDKPSPLIVLDLDTLTDPEMSSLRALQQRGSKIAAFQGSDTLSAVAAQLFGVGPDGEPVTGRKVGEVNGRPVVAGSDTLFIPMRSADLNAESAQILCPLLAAALQPRLQLPPGTAGYGFTSNGRAFALVEDWREEGRTVTLRYRASPQATAARAVDVNDHRTLTVRREGGDWLIDLPLRPGDGALVGIDEVTALQANRK